MHSCGSNVASRGRWRISICSFARRWRSPASSLHGTSASPISYIILCLIMATAIGGHLLGWRGYGPFGAPCMRLTPWPRTNATWHGPNELCTQLGRAFFCGFIFRLWVSPAVSNWSFGRSRDRIGPAYGEWNLTMFCVFILLGSWAAHAVPTALGWHHRRLWRKGRDNL